MSIIKDIYRGEVSFHARPPSISEERTQLLKECDRLETLLKEHLSQEDFELFREFNNYTDSIMGLAFEDKFEEGFLMGAKIQKELDKT